MTEMYHEMFQRFMTAKDHDEKIRILRNFAMARGGSRLPEFLNAAFNPAIKFDITKIPTFTPSPNPEGLNDAYLHQELAKLYLFIEGHPRRVTKLPEKKEQTILTQILSYLHKDEADLFSALLQKKVSERVRGLTAHVAKEAFPTLPFEVAGGSDVPKKKKKVSVKHDKAATV